MFFMIFFMCLIVIGTNISARRLAIITNQNINPPFLMKPVNKDIIQIDFLGNKFNYNLIPIRDKYSFVKSSIQTSWVTVKCNLAPRTDYLMYHWLKGIEQLKSDLHNIMKYF